MTFDPNSVDAVAVNGVCVYIIQLLKQWKKLPWINDESPKVTVFVGSIVAALQAAGMSYSWDRTTGVFSITGLTEVGVATFIWFCVKNYFFQHLIYKVGFKPR